MKITIGEALTKIESMRAIVRIIENGGSVDSCTNEIAEYLDEYIMILMGAKADV